MITKSSFDLFGLFIMFFNQSFNFMSINNKLIKSKFFIDEYYFFFYYFLINAKNANNKKLSLFFINKDYRIYMFIESIIKFRSLKKFNRFFWNKKESSFFFTYSNFVLRINIVNFFILGSFLEYLRMFFYNDHLRFCPFNLKKNLHLMSSDREYLNRQFIINILLNKYIIYLKLYNSITKPNININLLFIVKFFIVFNLLIQSKYISLNNNFLVLCFGKWLFFDYILFIYKNWFRFAWLFKFKIVSLWALYLLLRDVKEDSLYVLSLGLFYLFSKCFSYLLNIKLSTLNLSFDFLNNFILQIDLILIDYISSLYLKVLDNINVLNYRRLSLDLNYFWEIFLDWYYFDFLVFKDVTQKILKFNLEYFCFQYNPIFLDNNIYIPYKVSKSYFQSQQYLKDLNLYFLEYCLSYFIKNINLFLNIICFWQVVFLRQFFFKVYYKNINIFFSYFLNYKKFLFFINYQQKYTKYVYFMKSNILNG